MRKNNNKKIFWDYWSTSYFILGTLAALITAVNGLLATVIFIIANISK